jgi:hydrogenase nickel incorporation protein HypA/HybF
VHELTVARSVVETVAEAANGALVTKVRLRIGALSGVLPEAVRFCFPIAAQGTVLADAALVIDEIPGVVECSCGRTFTVTTPVLQCVCGNVNGVLRSGRELVIESFEVI